MPPSFSRQLDTLRSGDAGKLGVLMATAFVDMVGALMVIPLLPFYAEHLGANGLMVNILVAAFSAMQLVSAPLWGRVSDRYGRKPALLIGLSASVIAYVVFAFANTYWLLLVSRLVQGAGGGTTGVLQAYVADAVEPRNRARSLGWLSSATNLGVLLGPLIGSETTRLGTWGPGILAAALCLINIAFAARFLTESYGVSARARKGKARTPREAVQRVIRYPGEPSSRLIWMYSLGIGAFYGINATLILFLGVRFGVDEKSIGYFFVYMGALNILFRLGVLGRVVDRLGEVKTARLGATLLALGLFVIPFTVPVALPGLLRFLALGLAVGLIPLGTALNFPSVTGLLSRVVADNERGVYMGVQQTYGGIARSLYPLWAGFAWDALGTVVPFWTSGLLVAVTVLMGRGLEPYSSRTGEHAVVEAAAKDPRTSKETALAE